MAPIFFLIHKVNHKKNGCHALKNLRCFCHPEKNMVDFTGYPSNHISGCRLKANWCLSLYIFWRNRRIYFSHISGPKDAPCSKVAGFLGRFNFKNFSMATFFVFWVSHFVNIVWVICLWNKFDKKCSVRQCCQLCLWYQSLFELVII